MSLLTSGALAGALSPSANAGSAGGATSGAGNVTVNAGGTSSTSWLIIAGIGLFGILILVALFRGRN